MNTKVEVESLIGFLGKEGESSIGMSDFDVVVKIFLPRTGVNPDCVKDELRKKYFPVEFEPYDYSDQKYIILTTKSCRDVAGNK